MTATVSTELELRLYSVLKRIARYETPNKMLKSSQKDWGLGYQECLEMAYENIQDEANRAIKGLRVSNGV